MRRFLVLLILCFASSFGSKAQELRQGYVDSVKEFFRDLIDNHLEIREKSILDDAIFLSSHLDSSIFNVGRHSKFDIHQFLSPFYPIKIYKIDTGSKRRDSYPFYKKLDSLYFSKNEIDQISAAMFHQGVARWSPDIIFAGKIVTQKQIDSTRASLEIILNDQLKKVVDSNKRLIPSSPYIQDYEKARQNRYYGTRFLKYFNPVFIKKRKYAAILFYEFHAPMFASIFLAVYKNNNGHWQYFGVIVSASLN